MDHPVVARFFCSALFRTLLMVTLFNTDGDMSGRPTERDVLLVEALRLPIGREPCAAAIPSRNVNMPRESANMDCPPALIRLGGRARG